MPEVTSYAPGTPSYIDLATTDLAAAKAFYMGLFGWEAADMPMNDQGDIYSMMSKGGKDVAGIFELPPPMREMGVPPHWSSYVTVADVDAAAQAVTTAGGTLVQEPFDVFTAGRQAVASDPTGATFAMWQPRDSIGAYLVNEPGSLMWNELQTNDPAVSIAFYEQVLGWQAQTSLMSTGSEYTTFLIGDQAVAGMMEIQPDWGPVPPNWSIYLAVADCDEALEQAKQLGATPLMEVMDVPDVGKFTLIQDPQGAHLYLMTAPS